MPRLITGMVPFFNGCPPTAKALSLVYGPEVLLGAEGYLAIGGR